MRIGYAAPLFLHDLAPWLDVVSADELPRGYGHTISTRLAVELLRAGHDLEVVALDSSVTTPQLHRGPRLRLHVGPYRPAGRARDGFRVERRFVAQALRRAEAEVVHAHWTYEFALGALASNRPTLVTVNDWAPTIARLSPDPYRAVRLVMQGRTLARGRFFAAPSPHVAAKVGNWARVDVPVIAPGLPDGVFRTTPHRPRSCAPKVVAINSGFSALKNVKTLLEAFPSVRLDVPDVSLHLVGTDYEPGGPAHRWAAEHLLGDGVRFHGCRSDADLCALLGEADLFVHPSREESFGMVVAEAMAQRVPVVAGAHSGAVPWILEQGRVGVLADVRSPRSLAGAMCAVLGSTELWQRYSDRGFESVRRRFRIPPMVRDYEAQYERVLTANAMARGAETSSAAPPGSAPAGGHEP